MVAQRPERSVILLGVAAAHLILGTFLMARRPAVQPTPPTVMALLSFAAPLASPAPASVPDVVEPVITIPTVDVPELPNPALPVTADTVASAGPCEPLQAVQAALAGEPAVRIAIATTPVSARSVAQAIVIWNVDWAAVARSTEAPLASVRDVVTRTLVAMPSDCLAKPVAGPRLILIDTGGQTNVLAFGSGTWRWGDLAAAN